MSDSVVLKIIASHNGKEAYEVVLKPEEVVSILGGTESNADNVQDFYEALSKSSSYKVRAEVASRYDIGGKVIDVLKNDSSIEVLKNLVCCDAFIESASQEDLFKIIDLDVGIAGMVANFYERFSNVSHENLIEKLLSINDLSVTVSIIDHYETPVSVLMKLVKCSDSTISILAKRKLQSRN